MSEVYKSIRIAMLIFIVADASSQVDTTFYPSGKIKTIKTARGDKIIEAIVYKASGDVKYQWSIPKKTLVSYDAIDYTDALAEYFIANCPDYTLFQHYGNGPLMEMESYKDHVREGAYESYERDGKLIAKGQFSNWRKVGIWTYYDSEGNSDRHVHWFHHNYYEKGISIDYTILPVICSLFLIVLALFLFLKYSSFRWFFISYSPFTISIFVTLFLTYRFSSEQTLLWLQKHISNYVFPVLTTLVMCLNIVALGALLVGGGTRIRVLAVLFLLVGLGLSFLLVTAYISARIGGILG